MQHRPDIPTFKEKGRETIYESERKKYEETKQRNLKMLNDAKASLYENDASSLDVRGARSESTPLKGLKKPSERRAEVVAIKEQLQAYKDYK